MMVEYAPRFLAYLKHLNHNALIIALLCALFQCMVMVGAHVIRSGEASLPLDDSYIHLQYGKQIARGEYFQYQSGDPVSGGATSFLYVHLLAIGHLLGLDGVGLLYWLYGLTFFCVTGIFFRLLQIGQHNHFFFTLALLGLGITSGYLAWAYWSGMEIALLTYLILSAYERVFRDQTFTPTLWLWFSLLALCRPEGSIIAIMLILLLALKNFLHTRALPLPFSWKTLLPPAVFALALFGPNFYYTLAMGRSTGNGLIAKSLLYHPLMTMQEMISEFLSNLISILQFLSGLHRISSSPGEFVLPGLLLFAFFGFLSSMWEHNTKRRWFFFFLGAPLLLCIPAVATLEVWSLHSYRYLIPFFPLLWILGLIGLESLFRLLQRYESYTGFISILLIALLLQLVYLPTWSNRYHSQSTTIHEKQVHTSQWLNRYNPDAPVAINDAGALSLFGNYQILDLVGLVTNSTTIPYRMGEGGLYEELESMPEENRPQLAAVFPSWFEEMSQTYDIMHRPLVQFPDPFDTSFRKLVYRMNWSYAGMGDFPRDVTLKEGWFVIDQLDVANRKEEKEKHYSFQVRDNQFPEKSIPFRRNFGYHEEIDERWPDIEDEKKDLIPLMREMGILNLYDIVDSGRRITGYEQFTLSNINPESPLHLILRTCDNSGRHPRFFYRIRVYADGIYVDDWEIKGTAWNWYESVFTIPEQYLRGEVITLRLHNLGTSRYSYYDAYYYWACQSKELDTRESST